MVKITAFFMSIYFSVMALFGIPFTPNDLQPGDSTEITITQEQAELFKEIFETETQWLASLQLPNGAIPMTYSPNGELRVNPYFSDFAVLALLDDAEKYSDVALKYMDWHFAHLNTAEEDFNKLDGTIYDYVVTMENGVIVDEKISVPADADSYDSTDSYAATFLRVVDKYTKKTGDATYIAEHAEDLERIANVMCATLHNGLTFAKPNHRVKYLMDNCEVYEGAVAASEIFGVLADSNDSYKDTAEKYANLAETVKEKINTKLWNFVGGYYTAGMTYLQIPTSIFSWKTYYPCATAQLFPITCGIIEPETDRAKSLYQKFCNSYNWEAFEYPDAFYWGHNVLAAAMMNDIDSVTTYMTNYKSLMETHSWPLYNADSARVALAAYVMLEKI